MAGIPTRYQPLVTLGVERDTVVSLKKAKKVDSGE